MAIKFEQVSYVYPGFDGNNFSALKDINLEISDKGEFITLIGETGSGKSTLVQHMNALIKPTTGSVTVYGIKIVKDVKKKNRNIKLNPLRQKVGLVFQFPEYQLFEETVQKDIIFGGPDNKTPIGHWCKIMFRKTPNEKTGVEVKYPIKYGRDNGNSIWVEYEVIEQLKAWEMIEAKTAWITVSDDLLKELSENGFTVPKQVQGMDNFRKLLEEDQNLTTYLFDKFMRVFKK